MIRREWASDGFRIELRAGRPPSGVLATAQLILECLFPLGIMCALMLLMPDYRFSLLVSVGYAFMMLLITPARSSLGKRLAEMTRVENRPGNDTRGQSRTY